MEAISITRSVRLLTYHGARADRNRSGLSARDRISDALTGMSALVKFGTFFVLATVAGAGYAHQGAPERQVLKTTSGQTEVIVQGHGPLIVMLPSAARGAADFDEVAKLVADAGFRVLCVEPRGSGRTNGPHLGVSLRDLADELAEVIRAEKNGPAILVGHAAGSFVARMTAVVHPGLVRAVVVAGAGARSYRPELRVAVERVHDERLSEAERLVYLRQAFFAPASNPEVWLTGWRPLIQFGSGGPPSEADKNVWWGSGDKPVLELQGVEDPFKPREVAGQYRDEFGSRVTVVAIADASHALFPEKPQAVATAIINWARALPELPSLTRPN
jgi:pimeloyl-ACP methyl ester carboxylesterase